MMGLPLVRDVSSGAVSTTPKIDAPNQRTASRSMLNGSALTVAGVAVVWNLVQPSAIPQSSILNYRADISLASEIRPTFTALKKLFSISDSQVKNYVEAREDLIEGLVCAESAIRNYFPSENLTIDLAQNPDEQDSDHLVLKIWTDRDFEQAISLRDKFDQSWWLANYGQFGDFLSIRLVF
jgi:hypothetical protein